MIYVEAGILCRCLPKPQEIGAFSPKCTPPSHEAGDHVTAQTVRHGLSIHDRADERGLGLEHRLDEIVDRVPGDEVGDVDGPLLTDPVRAVRLIRNARSFPCFRRSVARSPPVGTEMPLEWEATS